MDFICMDLIGKFHPPTSHGNHYALTAVCMLTGFTLCVPLKTKTAEEVSKAYLDHIYSNFGGSIKIMTDNGTEFKNKLFKEVIKKLGMEFSIHSPPPYRPQSNGKIEGFHRFLKTCIGKHINYGLEWDELTPMATACYNFFPNCNARESAFFIMFGRDPINKLNMLLHSARRYFHDDHGLPNLEALKNIYPVVAQQLLNSREYVKKHHNQQRSESPVQAGDLILIKDNTAKSFEPLYKGNYRVVKVHGNNIKIRDYRGNISMVHITEVKKITLTEQVADEYENMGKQGRFSKKCIPRGYTPDFDWTTIHVNQDQPIKQTTQDPAEDTTTPAAPTEVEGLPSSHLRSKTKQQSTCNEQGQLERNPTPMDPPERNPAEIKVNTVKIAPKRYSLMQWTKTVLWAKRVSKHKAPVATRCTLMVAIAVYNFKCNKTNTLTL